MRYALDPPLEGIALSSVTIGASASSAMLAM
jgi:hypothetical protein